MGFDITTILSVLPSDLQRENHCTGPTPTLGAAFGCNKNMVGDDGLKPPTYAMQVRTG
jgi:hypothetical protein